MPTRIRPMTQIVVSPDAPRRGECLPRCRREEPMRNKVEVDRPQLEGRISVRDERMLGFASFGTPNGRPIFWLHGTPGARRQIPVEARLLAKQHDLRIIGIDRPGIGSSSPHVYANVLDFGAPLEVVGGTPRSEQVHAIGLSGGGPSP